MHSRTITKWLRSEEGRSLPFALVTVAVGALLVGPFLAHVSTSLLGSRAMQEGMNKQYSADAGVEFGIWKLVNDSDFRAEVDATPGTPVAIPDILVNQVTTSITVTLAINTTPTPTPTPQAGQVTIDKTVAPDTVSPGWTVTYTITIANAGPGVTTVRAITDTLASGFTYITGSTTASGLDDPGEPTIEGQTLTWSYSPPYPMISAGASGVLSFQATSSTVVGTYYNEAGVRTGPHTVLSTGPTAAVEVSPHDIVSTAGGVTTRARVVISGTDVTIQSWQIE